MHVLLCVEDDADVRSGSPGDSARGRAAALAAAWHDAAPRCAVTPLVLPATPRSGERGEPPGAGGPAGASTPGVFVPVTSLGLTRVAEQVSAATARLREQVAGADLAAAAVPVLDTEALHGGVVGAVASAAAELAVPVVVLAGRVTVTRREWSGAGVSGVHELGDDATAVARVARTWAPSWA